jgi:hypothetical protein
MTNPTKLLAIGAALMACGVDDHPIPQPAPTNTGPRFSPPPFAGGAAGVSGGATVSGGASGAGGLVGTGGSVAGAGGSAGAAAGSAGAGFVGGAAGSLGMAGAGAAGAGTAGAGTAGVAQGGNGAGGVAAAGSSGTGQGGGAAGLSGITVDINGTVLPKENVVAFILLGHSNMAGRSSVPSASRPYHFTEMNLYTWVYHPNNWQPALEPLTAGDEDASPPGRNPMGGPGTALLKQAADLAPNHYFVALGFGLGSAYCSQFLPGGLLYDQAVTAPKQLKGKVTFGGIVIMLGITERHGTDQDIANYPNCINSLVTAVRNDVGEPNIPLLITDYEMESTGSELSPTGAFAQQIIPRIAMIPSVVSNSAIVPTEDIAMQDDHHFNLDGQKEWSRRVLEIMQQKGWFPWSSR